MPIVVATAAVLASYLPVRRAAKIDPVETREQNEPVRL
jgi:ABC-type lipoprotein release transport system permease subunit